MGVTDQQFLTSAAEWLPTVLNTYEAIIDHPDHHRDLMLVISDQVAEIIALKSKLNCKRCFIFQSSTAVAAQCLSACVPGQWL